MAYCRYVKKSVDGNQEMDFSFSAVYESFQVIIRCSGKELATISGEGVRFIEIRNDLSGAGVHVVFDAGSGASEATLVMEPNLHCHWWV